MPKPKFLRFRTDAGEFSAPESRREALVKAGAKVVDKPAVLRSGDPAPDKPKVLRRSPDGQEARPDGEHKSGQKANTAEKEQV